VFCIFRGRASRGDFLRGGGSILALVSSKGGASGSYCAQGARRDCGPFRVEMAWSQENRGGPTFRKGYRFQGVGVVSSQHGGVVED